MSFEIIAVLAGSALIPLASKSITYLLDILQNWQSQNQSKSVKLRVTSKMGQTIEIEYSPDMSPEKIQALIEALEQKINTDEKSNVG